MIEDYTQYPICDTDIWVNVCLGNILPQFFWKYDKIIVADVVEEEIKKFSSNQSFGYISHKFKSYKENGSIFVIEHEVHISKFDRMILEQMLYEIGFKNDFRNKPPEENKVEFVSAIYADHFNLPFMKSNDGAFSDDGKGKKEFPDLLVKNWHAVVNEVINDDKERIKVNTLIENERKRLNVKNKVYKEKKMDDMLALLATKINNGRN
jgi:hypothetical protein